MVANDKGNFPVSFFVSHLSPPTCISMQENDMAKIEFAKVGAAMAVGAGDEAAEAFDRSRVPSLTQPFQNVTDWYRIGIAAIGGFLFSSNIATPYSESLLYAGSALAVKSISRVAREGFESTPAAAQRRATAGAMGATRSQRVLAAAKEYSPSAVQQEDDILVSVI